MNDIARPKPHVPLVAGLENVLKGQNGVERPSGAIRYAGVKHNGEEDRPWAAVIDARGATPAAALEKFEEAVKIARAQLVALTKMDEGS